MQTNLKSLLERVLRKSGLASRPSPGLPVFGSNPGALRMLMHVPPGVRPDAALIVVLHGCGQDAAAFAAGSGWTALADRLGVPLVLPEQVAGNNAGRCFNWFEPDDARRGGGEALSIRQMVAAAVQRFGSDERRIFVVGLSAGGAMAAALLAAYPDVFAGGAVVAGLPVGVASSVATALQRMGKAGPRQDAAVWAALVRAAAPTGYAGPWPRISIWQGGADRVVNPANAANLVTQWKTLHGEMEVPSMDLRPYPGVHRRVWRRAVEAWEIEGMPHGFPVASPSADPYLPNVGIDAATLIARFWELDATR